MTDKARRVADGVGYVHVGGQVFGPGDEVPAELQGEIRNPAVWADGQVEADTPTGQDTDAAVSDTADVSDKPKTAQPSSRSGSSRK